MKKNVHLPFGCMEPDVYQLGYEISTSLCQIGRGLRDQDYLLWT